MLLKHAAAELFVMVSCSCFDIMDRRRASALYALCKNGMHLKHLDDWCVYDHELVLMAVQENGLALQYACDALRDDCQIGTAAVNQNPVAFQFVGTQCRGNRELTMLAVRCDGLLLRLASAELRNDQDIVYAAVCSNAAALQYASIELRDNRVIALAAVSRLTPFQRAPRFRADPFQFISNRLRDDKEVVLAAVNVTPFVLQFAGPTCRQDEDVAHQAMLRSSRALEYLDCSFKMNKTFLLRVLDLPVSEGMESVDDLRGDLIQFLDDHLRDDKEIVLTAVRKEGFVLRYAGPRCRDDFDVVIAAVRQCGDALVWASVRLQHDRMVVLAALRSEPTVWRHVVPELRRDTECSHAVVHAMFGAESACSQAGWQRDRDWDMDASLLIRHCNSRQIELAISLHGELLQMWAPGGMLHHEADQLHVLHDKVIVLSAVRQNGRSLEHANSIMKKDFYIVLAAVQQNGCSLQFACSELQNNRSIVMSALAQNFQAWPFVGVGLRHSRIVSCRMRTSFRAVIRRDLSPVVMLLVFNFLFGVESPGLCLL